MTFETCLLLEGRISKIQLYALVTLEDTASETQNFNRQKCLEIQIVPGVPY